MTRLKRWNGRRFDFQFSETQDGPRSHWGVSISVVDQAPHIKKNSAYFTGLYRGEVQEKAEKWMRAWRN